MILRFLCYTWTKPWKSIYQSTRLNMVSMDLVESWPAGLAVESLQQQTIDCNVFSHTNRYSLQKIGGGLIVEIPGLLQIFPLGVGPVPRKYVCPTGLPLTHVAARPKPFLLGKHRQNTCEIFHSSDLPRFFFKNYLLDELYRKLYRADVQKCMGKKLQGHLDPDFTQIFQNFFSQFQTQAKWVSFEPGCRADQKTLLRKILKMLLRTAND